MIYRRDERGTLYQVLDWRLLDAGEQHIPLASEQELRAYLQEHPDTTFVLQPGLFPLREMQHADATEFHPNGPHVLVGTVRYDSTSRRIVTN